ncbi:MAG: PD-(D/E)XK nuclease family protein [Patescibacteria group bacterium]|jgi:CRISPR/Cas system-associated exonuclease Cas4 (RecB family)
MSRTRNLYDPASKSPYKVSRSKIEDFVKCPRCFYLDRRLGIRRPSGPPFNINKTVDLLLKKEFDVHRVAGTAHPLMREYGINAIPFAHEEMDRWRENFVGCQVVDEPSNFLVTGAVDDLWVAPNGEIIVVDYKATSKSSEVTLDADWQMSYKRQMEIYQWILRRMGFVVLSTGYFVYCNGRQDVAAFDGKIEFDVKVLPYTGNDDWIAETLMKMRTCLQSSKTPKAADDCVYCQYAKAAGGIA